MLRMQIHKLVLTVAVVLAGAGLWPSSAQTAPDTVQITAVRAVEEAQSPYGPFRVVFDLAAPLPKATDTHRPPEFFLGPELLRIPPGSDAGTHIMAYCDRVPPKPTTLRAEWRSSSHYRRGVIASAQSCDPAELLRHSKPARGQYEAAHIQRAAAPIDLLQAWADADVVALARFTRFDIEPQNKDVHQRYFQLDETLRGEQPPADAAVVLHPAKGFEYELGARYVLFLHHAGGQGSFDPANYIAVRVWWPTNDPFLTWLRVTGAHLDELRGGDPAAMEKAVGVFAAGLDNPAAIVRFTAATRLADLLTHGAALSDPQRELVTSREASEPDPAVKAVLHTLVAR